MNTPHWQNDHVTVWHGDALALLRADENGYDYDLGYGTRRLFPDASVDAVVTDPPYGLEFMGREWDKPGAMLGQLATGHEVRGAFAYGGTHSRGYADHDGRQFQTWCELWATECLRVLKPGGHMLAFGGSRTWHRLAAGIEDAGFEIRDSIAWLYATGFPKSMNVAAAIDKIRDDVDDVRVVCRWLRARIDEHPTVSIKSIAAQFGFHPRMVEHWAARDSDSQPTLPTLAQWDSLRETLGFGDELDAEVYRLNMRKGEPGEAWADREVVGKVDEWENRTNYALTSRDGLRRGASKNEQAQAWEGWGTALKPAFEPVVVARKPLQGTVAGNVLAYGTGALNIDGARVEYQGEADVKATTRTGEYGATSAGGVGFSKTEMRTETNPAGRWPTNVVLDESQAAELDRQSGTSAPKPERSGRMGGAREGLGMGRGGDAVGTWPADPGGGASRFFPTFRYEAKAPTSERPKAGEVQHPTVKPLDLMRWLVRLVTPPGGVILEPFAGSGTTAEAAVLEGFHCIAIEREADYLQLIERRLAKPMQQSLFGDWDDDGDAA